MSKYKVPVNSTKRDTFELLSTLYKTNKITVYLSTCFQGVTISFKGYALRCYFTLLIIMNNHIKCCNVPLVPPLVPHFQFSREREYDWCRVAQPWLSVDYTQPQYSSHTSTTCGPETASISSINIHPIDKHNGAQKFSYKFL